MCVVTKTFLNNFFLFLLSTNRFMYCFEALSCPQAGCRGATLARRGVQGVSPWVHFEMSLFQVRGQQQQKVQKNMNTQKYQVSTQPRTTSTKANKSTQHNQIVLVGTIQNRGKNFFFYLFQYQVLNCNPTKNIFCGMSLLQDLCYQTQKRLTTVHTHCRP